MSTFLFMTYYFYRLLLDKLLGLVHCVILDDVGAVSNLSDCVLAPGDERTVERVYAHVAVSRDSNSCTHNNASSNIR